MADFHPPSWSSSSSSVSSPPLFVLASAIDDNGGWVSAPPWVTEAAKGVVGATSGVRIESESESTPESAVVKTLGGCMSLSKATKQVHNENVLLGFLQQRAPRVCVEFPGATALAQKMAFWRGNGGESVVLLTDTDGDDDKSN